MKKSSSFAILAAGILWGTMSVFVKNLAKYGFTSMQISAFRIIVAAAIFLIILFFYDRKLLQIKLRDVPLFAAIGIISVLCLAYTYFRAIGYSVSTAAILLYTAPSMVMLMGAVIFKEKLTKRKLLALVCAFLGCVCTVGKSIGSTSVGINGILFGLAAGFSYATYSIFGTILLKKYHPLTVTAMAFLFAAVGAIFCCNIFDMAGKAALAPKGELALWIVGIGIVTAVLPYLLYTVGLSGTEAGKASIMASVEPLVASVIGIAFYGDEFSIFSVLGISLILGAVIILNSRSGSKTLADEKKKN